MKVSLRALRVADAAILALVLAATVVSGYFVYGRGGNSARLVIQGPTGTWMYDLKTDRTVEIPGKLGNTIIEISGGEAQIQDSPCPTKTCVAEPAISHKGDWSACLPNGVIMRIEGGGNEGEFDAVVY